MTTFLRLELAARDGLPSPILINVEQIVRIHPNWPHGCTIVTTDDVSLHVRPGMDEIQQQMIASGGRITIKWIGHMVDEHGIDPVYEAARADMVP